MESFTQFEYKGNDNPMVSYIYLLREREHYESNTNVYKFGRCTQPANNCISRLRQYKKGSEIIMTLQCDDSITIENKIRSIFKEKFRQHVDGHEHYYGDVHLMMNIIWENVKPVPNRVGIPLHSGCGKSTIHYEDGTIYIGQLLNNMYHGTGKLINPKGEWYDGEFIDGNFVNGIARVKYEDGGYYEGPYLNGVEHGEGKIIYYGTNKNIDYDICLFEKGKYIRKLHRFYIL